MDESAAKAAASLWDEAIALAESLGDEDWSRPTPCTRWDVKDLLAHFAAAQKTFDGGPQPDPPAGWEPPAELAVPEQWTEQGVVARRVWSPAEVIAELRETRDGHIARVRTADADAPVQGPVGQTTEAGLLRIRCYDLWVHLQDLALALDREPTTTVSSPGAEEAFRMVEGVLPWLFGKQAGAPEGARLQVRLGDPPSLSGWLEGTLVVREGRARWDGENGTGDALAGTPGALTLVCSGRRSAEEWRADGLLDWSGEHAAALVQRARIV